MCVKKIIVKTSDSEVITGLLLDYNPDTYELFSFLEMNPDALTPISKFVLIKRLLRGLVELHKLKVVHRDIKPENLLINPHKLQTHYIDFGASCTKHDKKCLKKIAGTPNFLSPELVMFFEGVKSEYDLFSLLKAGDVWALGRTCIELCFFKELGRFNIFEGGSDYVENIKNRLRPFFEDVSSPSIKTSKQAQLDLLIFCFLLMEPDIKVRPSAEKALEVLETYIVKKLGYDGKEIEDVAMKYALDISVVKGTKIFPGGERRRTI